MGEKKQIKISLKTAIILTIFVVFLIEAIVFGCFAMNKINNRKYLNSKPLGYNSKEINEEEIINLVDLTNEEYKEFKENFIGTNVTIEKEENQTRINSTSLFEPSSARKLQFKEQAEDNFDLLKNYIFNRNEDIYASLLNKLRESEVSKNGLDSIYASVCSGMVKNYIRFEEYTIKFDEEEGIKKGIGNKEMMFSVNNKFLVIFTYSKNCFWISIYDGTKYDFNKDAIIEEKIFGYNELLYWERIKTTPSFDKPIIYLYPTEETETTVKLLNAEKITCSYPKYVDEWKVLAKPNGDLIDLETGKNLYSLYYESEIVEELNVSKEGFVVKGEDSAKFLEEKLAVLGLTEREAEEFIIYWLPKLESNRYNYIRFATDQEINNNMQLEINPNPDTIIRVLMIFKELENPIEVEEQKLVTPERIGFTVVEWGGTEIK